MKKCYFLKSAKSKTGILFFPSFLLALLLWGFSAKANIYAFTNSYSGAQATPPNASPGGGIITGTYDDATNTITYTIFFGGLMAPTTVAHFHAPAPPGSPAPVIVPHAGFPAGVTAGLYAHTDVLTDAQEAWLLAGLVYSNIHTTAVPSGEIRAQIILGALPPGVYPFTAIYKGAKGSGTGIITGTFNENTNAINYTIMFRDLMAPTTVAHFHAPASPGQSAPVVIPHVGFPAGVTSGTYMQTNMLTPQQKTWLFQGLMYSNIHTTAVPAGEIRAQIILGPPAPCVAPSFLNNRQIVLDASCQGNDGNITIVPLSGTPPYQYSIDGGATYVAGPVYAYTFQNLAVGTYQLRLKDANGCESEIVTREVKLVYGVPCGGCIAPTFLDNSQIVLDASCNGGDGSISIIPTSGTAPFMYSIDGGATYVSGPNGGYTFQNLSAGTYQLRLKDAGGCESAIVNKDVKANAFGPCATIQALNPRLRSGAIDGAEIRAYPNPSRGQFQVQLQRFSAERVQVQILDSRGAVLQTRTVNARETNTVDINLSGKAKGLYLIRVVSEKGTQVQKITVQ
jgi:hypothetical protein